MRQSSTSFQRQQQREFVRQTAPTKSKQKRKKVRGKWQAFLLWFKLGAYRFTRAIKNIFK
jgi:hypothetical protein